MALITEEDLINRVKKQVIENYLNETVINSADVFLKESKQYQKLLTTKNYDIFLSHSSSDARHVVGLKLLLEDLGHSVYVDWIEDPELDRSKVTKENAALLRDRMNNCKSLLYAFSKNAVQSTWMPWELGYFDGIKGYVAIVPILKNSNENFTGNEYLGLYPYADLTSGTLWINGLKETSYKSFNGWIND